MTGNGVLLDVNRGTLATGKFELSIDSVAIFETNVTRTSGSVHALAVMTGISLAVTAFCIVNPKVCFGSCPTFYTSAGGDSLLIAEGFSSSVAPCLEASDIDALYRIHPKRQKFSLTMKNEALETHVVRYADLLIVPRPSGERILKRE